MTERSARRHGPPDPPDQQRTPFQRDRDRIIHSSALRRLANVTQVVGPGEGHVFHNRLTHTLKVAQIARRLAEKLIREDKTGAVAALGGIDPEVCEAAALAHDLGHPPFGHIAEKELDSLLQGDPYHVFDGYEGNAQSFRIVTKLATRSKEHAGLNLTRATLNALLKYPWQRSPSGKKSKKWGFYHHTELAEFNWVREGQHGDERKSVEAEIMDWSDDIAYAVHDLEDFFRAGLAPLDRLTTYKEERERFLRDVFRRWEIEPTSTEAQRATASFERLMDLLSLREPYTGTTKEKAVLRAITSSLIDTYVRAIELHVPATAEEPRVLISENFQIEINLLKEIVWHYVIMNPSLATQQYGQARIVRELFDVYFEAATKNHWRHVLPARFRDVTFERGEDGRKLIARQVADIVSGMSDVEALTMHGRLFGRSPGSVLDSIPR